MSANGEGDRLDRIEAALAALASSQQALHEDVSGLTEQVAITDEQVRQMVRLHVESRQDIDRLYTAAREQAQRSAEDSARLREDFLAGFADLREDIDRLYAAWPEHLRHDHTTE
jgi:hypothetical protein